MSNASTRRSPKKKTSAPMVLHDKSGHCGAKSVAGVVSYCVHGTSGKNVAPAYAPSRLIQALREGLPFQELEDLQASLAVPMEKLIPMLGISKATLHRRKAEGRLGSAESDRVIRFARLLGKALEVMESEENARQWLTSPQVGLAGAIPLDYADTEVGAREVE